MTEAVEHSVLLPAEPRSARDARRFVSDLLEASGHPEWRDAAELAVSEIVTNGVLHAHTPLTLTVLIEPDQLRIDVLDHNPALPSPRRYDQQATTGRGMALVAAITTSHGVTSRGPEGKVVWFTLGSDPAPDTVDALLDSWDDEALSSVPAQPAGQRVVLVGMPSNLWLSARQHHDALLRELALHHASDSAAGSLLVTADLARGTIWHALEAAINEAQQGGVAADPPVGEVTLPEVPARFDLELYVRPEEASSFGVLQDVLDEAEALAGAERLLMRPALPEIIAVRDWACEQIIAQLSGMAPTPWPGADAVADTPAAPGLRAPAWDPTPVREATRGAVAADDANRIIAVSGPFAEELAWDPAELVGRRIVALIPARLREAHVAGFTRHLATGEAHVLDVPLELPVLRGDGTEVLCAVLIESTATQNGRAVYTAWITPLPQ